MIEVEPNQKRPGKLLEWRFENKWHIAFVVWAMLVVIAGFTVIYHVPKGLMNVVKYSIAMNAPFSLVLSFLCVRFLVRLAKDRQTFLRYVTIISMLFLVIGGYVFFHDAYDQIVLGRFLTEENLGGDKGGLYMQNSNILATYAHFICIPAFILISIPATFLRGCFFKNNPLKTKSLLLLSLGLLLSIAPIMYGFIALMIIYKIFEPLLRRI